MIRLLRDRRREVTEAGWSLIEILIGIAIILILMTSVGLAIVGNVDKARQAAACTKQIGHL